MYSHVWPPDLPALALVLRVALLVVVIFALLHLLVPAVAHARASVVPARLEGRGHLSSVGFRSIRHLTDQNFILTSLTFRTLFTLT